MENQTAFDLTLAIQNWREGLAQSPSFRDENLNELESHLRDSIAVLQTRGLSAEEAFIIATKRIGKSGALEKEFGKVNGTTVWLDRCLWALIAFQAWVITMHVSRLIQNIVMPFGYELNEILPGLGLREIPPDYLPFVLGRIFSPMPIALVLGILAWYIVRRKREATEFFIQRLLRRPTALAGAVFTTSVVSEIFATLTFQFWDVSIFRHQHLSPVFPVELLVLEFGTAAFWAWLTMLVGRKRLRAAAA